jgi:hypothetical protein
MPTFQFMELTTTETFAENVGDEGLSITDLDVLKVPSGGGKSWELEGPEGERSERELLGVVIHFNQARAYWQDAYSGEGKEPDCSSSDGITGYGDPGGQCVTCPMAAWGSAGGGSRAQACKSMSRVYVMLEDDLLPHLLQVPPSSLAIWKKYRLRLGTTPYWKCLTRLTLDKAVNRAGIAYSQVGFAMAGRLDEEKAGRVAGFRAQFIPLVSSWKPMAAVVAEEGVDPHSQAEIPY